MLNRIAVFASALTLASLPAVGSTFQIYEDSLGSPGVTAQFPTGSGLVADIDFDANSAEGGGLLFGGPSEIDIRPTGSLVFVAFAASSPAVPQTWTTSSRPAARVRARWC